MRSLSIKGKKSVIGPVVSVFVMVLVISILAGLTFLFVTQLKSQVVTTTTTASGEATDQGAWINSSGYTLNQSLYELGFTGPEITSVVNASNTFTTANYTLVGNVVYNASALETNEDVNITYTFDYISDTNAYEAVNDTEAAGATVVNYLSLIFLAVIFGAILTLVLRIILPYINLGKRFDGF